MIDNFSILLSHGLLMIAFWILIQRADTDVEDPPLPDSDPEGFAHQRTPPHKIDRLSAKNPMRPVRKSLTNKGSPGA